MQKDFYTTQNGNQKLENGTKMMTIKTTEDRQGIWEVDLGDLILVQVVSYIDVSK